MQNKGKCLVHLCNLSDILGLKGDNHGTINPRGDDNQ